MKKVILPSATLLVGFGIGYLLAQPLPPSGGGKYSDAPNGTWKGSAESLYETKLLQGSREFYSFSIETSGRSPTTLREVQIDAPKESEVEWREEGEIRWATNSAAVTFVHSNASWELELKLKLQPNSSTPSMPGNAP
jgi:hypothetical protein